MKLEKIEEKKEELTEVQSKDLFRSIVMGQDVTEEVETSRGKFKIKFPRAKDLETIAKLCASRLMGIPMSCFDINSYNLMQEIATLDVLVITGPDWYELAKKKNPNFSWREIPSQNFIQEVYALAYNFRLEVQKQIEPDPTTADNRVATSTSSDDSDEPGLFDNISGEQKFN